MTETFTLRVNGRDCEVRAEPDTPLLYILRNDLKLKGTRFGCGEGQCGACTVLLDGHPVTSLVRSTRRVARHGMPRSAAMGAVDGRARPVRQRYAHAHAMRCGSCRDAAVLAEAALLLWWREWSSRQRRPAV